MISKMNFYGVQVTALDWFMSYLSNGTPQCLVNGSLLRICSLKCRVPQCLFFFLEGLIHRRKFEFQNRLGLYLKGNLHLKIDWTSL